MDADIRVGDLVAFNHADEGRREGVVRAIDGNRVEVVVWLSPTIDEIFFVPIEWLTVPF